MALFVVVRAMTPRTVTLVLAQAGIDCVLLIDGIDVSRYITAAQVIARVGEPTRVLLEIASSVEVTGEAAEVLRGLVYLSHN
jgi:hypothetical protein